MLTVCVACSSNCKAGCTGNQTGAGKCDQCDPGYGIAPDGSCGRTYTLYIVKPSPTGIHAVFSSTPKIFKALSMKKLL